MRKNIYSFLLIAVLLLIGGNMWANVPQALVEPAGYAFNPDASGAPIAAPRRAAMDATQQVRLQYAEVDVIYNSLQDAFNNLPANSTPATVTLLTDVNVPTTLSTVTMAKYHHVTLDLNGHSVLGSTEITAYSAVITNNGTLVINDSQGGGAMYNIALNPEDYIAAGYEFPTMAYNVITNQGTLIINGGHFENRTRSNSSYVVDNRSGGKFVLNGGTLKNQATNAIRMFCTSTTLNNEVIINGGLVWGYNAIWMQNASQQLNKGSLTINGGEIRSHTNSYTNGGKLKNAAGYLNCSAASNSSQYDYSAMSIYITGGTFNENVFAYKNVKTRITGGTFNGNFDGGTDVQISGGFYAFNTDDGLKYYTYVTQTSYTKAQLEEWGYVVMDYHDYNSNVPAGSYWALFIDVKTSFYNNENNWIVDGYCAIRVSDADPKDWTCEVRPCEPAKQNVSGGNWCDEAIWGLTGGVVPTASDNVSILYTVTIPAGCDAVANRLEIADEGEVETQIIVESGATLTVGNGGIITNNTILDPIIVRPGGRLIVNGSGIVNNGTKKDVIIKADATGQGELVFGPYIPTAKTQSEAAVELYTYSKKVADQYYFQLFGSPVTGVSNTNKPTTSDATTTYMYMWDYEGQQAGWRQLSDWAQLNTPFAGYNVTNTSNGGIVYTFDGDLIGNGNQQLVLPQAGYCVMGNSYTAPIDVKALFAQIDNDMNQNQTTSPIEKTVYVYNAAEGQYMYTNELGLLLDEMGVMPAEFKKIQPMQGFLLNLQNGTSAGTTVNYANAVYNPIVNAASTTAPARSAAHTDMTIAKMYVRGGNFADEVSLVESNEFSAEVENGKDALKYVDANNISLYANNNGSKLAMVATDNLEGTTLAFQAKSETTYTITFDRAINCDYVLYDYTTGQQVAMTEGNSYTFTAAANSFNPARFSVAKAKKITTGVDSNNADASVDGVYTVLGNYLGTAEIFNSLPAGVYVVNGVKVVK